VYEYRCGGCNLTFRDNYRDDWVWCPRCDCKAQRVWGFSVASSFQGGYNHSVGGYVHNQRDLTSILDRASDEAQAPRTVWDAAGNPHDVTPPPCQYVPVDLRDKEACGATDEGLPATYDALRQAGNDPAADHLRKLMD
jgi:hypothetical protein